MDRVLKFAVEMVILDEGPSKNEASDVLKNIGRLDRLEFSNQELNEIPNLSYLFSLKEMNFSKNEILSIPNALKSNTKLSVIDLSHNNIEDLLTGLKSLENLKRLDISHNKLQTIDFDTSLPQNLEILDYSNNSQQMMKKIKWINQKAKKYFLSLKILNSEKLPIQRKKQQKMKKKNKKKKTKTKKSSYPPDLLKKVTQILREIEDQKQRNIDSNDFCKSFGTKYLDSIIRFLRKEVSVGGNPPKNKKKKFSEVMYDRDFWEDGDTQINCFMLDAFLYNEEEKRKMFIDRKIAPFFCEKCKTEVHIDDISELSHSYKLKCRNKCKGRVIKDRNQYSCSLSVRELDDIFEIFKNNKDVIHGAWNNLKGKRVLDIGSRLGNVMYYYYFNSECSRVYGVEIDPFFVELTKKVVQKFRMEEPRISVIVDDIKFHPGIIKECDIIHFSNPFIDFPKLVHKEYLDIFRKNLEDRKGVVIVSSPSIPFIFEQAGISEKKSLEWLVYHGCDQFKEVFVYTVK